MSLGAILEDRFQVRVLIEYLVSDLLLQARRSGWLTVNVRVASVQFVSRRRITSCLQRIRFRPLHVSEANVLASWTEKRLNACFPYVYPDWTLVFKKRLFRPLGSPDELPYSEISFES